MAQQIKRFGKWLVVLLPLALIVVLVARPQPVHALTFSSPFWTNTSSNLECACASSCSSCGGPSIHSPEGVLYTSGAFTHSFHLLDNPAKVGTTSIDLVWRSDISGHSQFGRGWIPSWETTVQKVGTSESSGGHYVVVNYPTGFVATFTWSGSAYASTSCGVLDVLSRPSGPSGPYRLTDKYGGKIDFTADGVPDLITDTRGNTTDPTYNSSEQITAFTDDRGFTYTFSRNSDGFVDELDNPTSRVWTFNYDTAGNLTSVVTPPTQHQTSGVTYEFGYDSQNRMTSIKDGRGNTVKTIAYVGSTYQVDSITMDGDTVDYAYATNRVDRTDRLGNVFRTHLSGNKIVQTDMWVGGAAQFVRTYSYTGDYLAYTVLPRGNRIDYTWSNGNLTERRHRTANTGTNDSSDIVHAWTYSSNFMATYTDPLGNVTEYTRNAAGDVTQIDFPDVTNPSSQTASKSFTYNGSGQLTQVTDEEGKVTTYSYFTSGDDVYLLQTVTVDPSGLALATTYGYDGWWNVDSVTDPRGNATTITSDALRRQIEVAAPSTLSKVKYTYDADGRVTKKEVQNRDKDNAVVTANEWFDTTYVYSTLGDLTSITEEITGSTSRTTSFDYDDEQQRIRVTKPEGNKVKTDYNSRGLVWKVTRGETSSVASTVENTYDPNGNLTEIEDGRGNSTTYAYDLFDRRTRATNALSHYTVWTYDKSGRVTETARKDSSDNPLLRSTSYYDERGRHWKTSDLRKDPGTTHSDAVTTTARKKTGHVHTVTDARSTVTTYAYDNAWRRTRITDAFGNYTDCTFDANGNATAWTVHDEDGSSDVEHAYEATYDALNRRLTTVEIDRTNSSNRLTTTNGYDSRGNLVWQVNAAGNPTRWTYDGLSRMRDRDVALTVGTPITNFTSFICTQWEFDKNDRLTKHEDDADNATTWAYDACDRATTMTYPNSTTITYTYDANDNITQTIDAAGNDIDDTYDVINRRTARDVTRATGFLDTTAEDFTYDPADRMTMAEDNDYKVEFTYAVRGMASQVYEEKQSYATGTAYLKTVTRTWDAVGNKATEAYPSGLTLTYAWTDVNQLASISDGTNTIGSWTYGGRRVKQVDLQNGTKTLMSYSGFRGEIATIHHKNSSNATILQLDYGYDANHDRTYERYGSSGSTGDAFEYDKARRLTVAWMGSTTPSSPSGVAYVQKIEYNMDDDGNRTSVVTTPYGSSATTVSYADNNLNQYTAVGGGSRSHDGNGNVTDDGIYLFEYNYRNLIVRAKLKSTSVTVGDYKYDAFGRRVEKAVTGATYRYIYSSDEIMSVYTSTGTWKQDYVYDEELDGLVMLSQADVLDYDSDSNTSEPTRSFYHRNPLGSVMAISDAVQATVAVYRYQPYGEVAISRGGTPQSSDPLGQLFAFQSMALDSEVALYSARNRHYDWVRGRFLQRDPLGVAAGPNVYEFVFSSPTNLTDPFGLEPAPPSPPSTPNPAPPKRGLSAGSGRDGDQFEWWLLFTPTGRPTKSQSPNNWLHIELTVKVKKKKSKDGTWEEAESHAEFYEQVKRTGESAFGRYRVRDYVADGDGYCALQLEAQVSLQQGSLKAKDKDGKKGAIPSSRIFISYSSGGIDVQSTPTVYNAADFEFVPSGPKTIWKTSYGWDYCADIKDCPNKKPHDWRNRPTTGSDQWENITPPQTAITPSDDDPGGDGR